MEKVHTFALKKLLNVSPRTPNDMAYGETGRFPLYVHSYTACIKYWLQVRQVLYKFGFGFVWENQGVQNPETFIKAIKQRLIDCHSQNWHEHISNSTRFTIYRMFKISISLEPYFTSVTNKHIRDVLIRFRIGASNIRTPKLRYVAYTPGDLMCPLCNTAYEDEMHTLLYCEFLDDLRQKYIPRNYTVPHSCVTLRRIMQDTGCFV